MEECMMLVGAGIVVVGGCSGVVLLGGGGTRNGGLQTTPVGDCRLVLWKVMRFAHQFWMIPLSGPLDPGLNADVEASGCGVVCDVFVENGQLSLMVILAVMEFNKFIEHGGCVIGSDRWLRCGGGDLVC
ncbi:Hypothetical predicted protein [Paramuricea clavata]|uniref:Uncharacterized protein n=1 Tax=Paramuricea clavata TaxID=317549 RepID=A0A7D9INE3_PARCT|nr:Hypothetical predicted protein [Paramuricea clavata]